MIRYISFTTIPDWGKVGVAVSPEGLTAVLWGATAKGLVNGLQGQAAPAVEAALRCAASQWLVHLRGYFAGQRRAFPLDIAWQSLRPFQREVLRLVAAIPYGETRTYGWIAAAVGKPGAARAVGRAVATNPMPIVIPCHRVVAADGGLGGFSGPGGLETKARLLALEAAHARKEDMPHARA